jgi:predicted nuclease of predicted toxin-antitoxin system
MAIRFHLDENMPHAVAEGLRRRDIDVTTTTDARLVGATDQEQLLFARGEGRVLVTRDADLLRLNAQGAEHAGIVYWTERRSIGQLISALDVLVLQSTEEEMRGRVVFL